MPASVFPFRRDQMQLPQLQPSRCSPFSPFSPPSSSSSSEFPFLTYPIFVSPIPSSQSDCILSPNRAACLPESESRRKSSSSYLMTTRRRKSKATYPISAALQYTPPYQKNFFLQLVALGLSRFPGVIAMWFSHVN
jgi:hypothetical protein